MRFQNPLNHPARAPPIHQRRQRHASAAPFDKIMVTCGIDHIPPPLLQQLKPEEKIDMISGINGFDVRPIERLDVPKMHMSDGPCGTRNDGPTTAYPAPVGPSPNCVA